MRDKSEKIIANNKKARHDYFIENVYEAGISLSGTEVKSIREGSCNIKDSYAYIRNNEVFVINMFVKKYKEGNIFNRDELRQRKLLLHKKEILKLKQKIEMEGYTLIPLKVYFKKNKVKILLGVCKGKKNYDKREALKDKDIKMQTLKELKKY